MDSTERKTLFTDVIVPLPVPGWFTYRVPNALNEEIAIGKRVVVQFGPRKLYTGLIYRIHSNIPTRYTPKYILGVLDDQPVLNENQYRFWEWISDYYLCHPGEVMVAALPAVFKLNSETKVVLENGFHPDHQILSEYEYLITEALMLQPTLTLTEVSKIVGFQKILPLIKTMVDKKLIALEEEINERYIPKTERFVKLTEAYKQDDALRTLMDELGKRAFKQLEVVLALLTETRKDGNTEKDSPAKIILQKAEAGQTSLKSLADKGVIELFDKQVSRLGNTDATADSEQIELTIQQQKALNEIKHHFIDKNVVLLHGVTSSGKTELYIKLIREQLEQQKQVLFMLPEIALTAQIINRIQKYFGKKAGIYHSRYNLHERGEIWQKVQTFDPAHDNDYQIVIGPRSALFLPFKHLGLIIVDEEHDNSFKQTDPAPRYQARDAAIMLASLYDARVLLGSATPSYESYYNALQHKYGLVKLTERYGGVSMPDIQIVNVREEKRRKGMQSHFSPQLLDAVSQAIEQNEQAILFQNRRGFSLRLECNICHWIPECKNCDVSLIYHKKQNLLRCHYCGYSIAVPEECPECKSTSVMMHGFGTEKIEEELGLILRKARIARLDLDTTRSKNAYRQILDDFENGKTDILVGTQMVTKGLDFEKVRVVGILNADNMLSYPDFRAFEQSYQLMAQVSGRAGRKDKQGIVMIQTHQPGHPILKNVVDNAYEDLFYRQMETRLKFNYPPYYRLIVLKVKHRDFQQVDLAAARLTEQLKAIFGHLVLGPEYPNVSRIKSLFIKHILIKFDRRYHPAKVKTKIKEIILTFEKLPAFKSVILQIDVDPQ